MSVSSRDHAEEVTKGRSMSEPASRYRLRSGSAVALTGAGLIFVAGLIHLVLTPAHLEEATRLGLLYFVNGTVGLPGVERGT